MGEPWKWLLLLCLSRFPILGSHPFPSIAFNRGEVITQLLSCHAGATGHTLSCLRPSLPRCITSSCYSTVSVPCWACGSLSKGCDLWLHLESNAQISSVFKFLSLSLFFFLLSKMCSPTVRICPKAGRIAHRAPPQEHSYIQAPFSLY